MFQEKFIKKVVNPFLGSVFLLSAIGKSYDLANFSSIVLEYGFPKFFSVLIISFEYILAFNLSLLVCIRRTCFVAVLFLITLSIIYTYGYYIIGIESCGCFGAITMINPSSFSLSILKNLVLIFLLVVNINLTNIEAPKGWFVRLVSLTVCLLISFSIINLNASYAEDFVLKYKGKHVDKLGVGFSEANNYNIIFLFSPKCIHCINKIPKVNLLANKKENNVVGIISNSSDNQKALINDSLQINFDLLWIERSLFQNISKRVPVLFYVKNDTIKKIERN